MTDTQKEAIKTLRREGFSYGKISEKTGIKYEAVKSCFFFFNLLH